VRCFDPTGGRGRFDRYQGSHAFRVPGDLNSSDAALKFAVQARLLRAEARGCRPDQPTTRKESAMASLIPYDPLVDTGIDELFRGFFQPIRMEGRTAPLTIKIDVTEDNKSYTVHAEIPGVSKDDIQVTIEGNQVTLGAEVKREKEVKDGQRVLRSERFYGNAFRSITLPTEVDETHSEARYDKGVLELKLVKKAASAGKRLNVQ
jgi:HSP20 family protein